MKTLLVLAALALASTAQVAHAQFESGVVFDPTQSAHAAQQILQANQLYTTTLKTTQNIIGAYNLAQRMATAPSSLYLGYTNLGRQFWVPFTEPSNTYGNLQQFITAIATGNGAAGAYQSASVQRTGQISGYNSLGPQGQQIIAAQGATVDLSDAINASSLQTVGSIRASSAQRETDISQLEAASHSSDPAQHTELATLQRINQALLIELRTQQEASEMLQTQALQQMIGQKAQQDNLKSLFQLGNGYQQNFNTLTPQQTIAGTQWVYHY
jgi:hypothetical protein